MKYVKFVLEIAIPEDAEGWNARSVTDALRDSDAECAYECREIDNSNINNTER